MDTYAIGVGDPDPDAPDFGDAFHSVTWNAGRNAWEYRPRYVHGSTLPIRDAITYSTGRDRISNADAAYSCSQRNPECNAGGACSLHKYCGAWGPRCGSGGATP